MTTNFGNAPKTEWGKTTALKSNPRRNKKSRKMARVKLKRGTKIGYRVSDIGAGGKEHNIRTGVETVKRNPSIRKQFIIELLHKNYGIWYISAGVPGSNTTQNRAKALRERTEAEAAKYMREVLASFPAHIKKNFVWIRVVPS